MQWRILEIPKRLKIDIFPIAIIDKQYLKDKDKDARKDLREIYVKKDKDARKDLREIYVKKDKSLLRYLVNKWYEALNDL